MKTFTFINRNTSEIHDITAQTPAEAIRQLVAQYGVGPYSILGIY